jgi:Bacteriocin-protection, YdeI or OmpD-Associated
MKTADMALSLAQKLRIKEGTTLLTIHAPAGFAAQLQPLPSRVRISGKTNDYTQVHWFVKNKADVEKELNKVLGLLRDEVVCWIYYPKGSSGMQTDLTRDKGWDSLTKKDNLQWLSLVSFNDSWSAFAMRLKTAVDQKKNETKRLVFDFVDPVSKTVKLPEDFASTLKSNKKAASLFEGLSFTNKKEYIEWIVSAKREETRKQRIRDMLERLGKGWKNPANR